MDIAIIHDDLNEFLKDYKPKKTLQSQYWATVRSRETYFGRSIYAKMVAMKHNFYDDSSIKGHKKEGKITLIFILM